MMELMEAWWLWGSGVVVLVLVLALKKTVRPFRRLVQINQQRLKRIRNLHEAAQDPAVKQSLRLLLDRVDGLEHHWFLSTDELNPVVHSRMLVQSIARQFHPDSDSPWMRARIGPMLNAFLEFQNSLHQLVQIPGLRMATRFRLRHLTLLGRAQRTKDRWDASPLGQAAKKWHLFFVIKWATTLARLGDALFWMMKSGSVVLNDVVLRHVLIYWYLSLGDAALTVYRESIPEIDPELPDEDVLEDMESLGDPEADDFVFPEVVKEQVEASRRDLMLHTSLLSVAEIRHRLVLLSESIAAHYHPESPHPMQEATLYECLKGVERLCGQIAALQSKPVIKQVLGLRLSHVMKVKSTADKVMGSDWMEWLKKYQVGSAVKYSTLAYRVLKKGQPGLIFKDVAFTIAREGLKRWLALYLHRRVAEESVLVYRR